jgi:hypothetical protein
MKGDDCPRAILKFKESQQLDPSAATLVNLATCYVKLVKTASAWRTYREAASAASQEGNANVGERALRTMEILAPRLIWLNVVPPLGTTLMSLKINGELVGESDKRSVAIDPGENIVEAAIEGRAPWLTTVNAIAEGRTIVVEVPAPVPESSVRDSSEWTGWRTASLVSGGIGLTSVVTGVVLALKAKSTHEDALQHCRSNACDAVGHQFWDDANRGADAASYAFGVGAIFTAVGVGLWFASPSHSTHAITIAPLVSVGRPVLGLSVDGNL